MKHLLSSRLVITIGMITALAVTTGFFQFAPMFLKWD
jgi:hypothetical protein